ncbi:glucan biosynthesis protein [Beijerinckia indica]|uniref:Periplasmic glucan biosynthesis protein MdoG n=1 Tax=Beijerinckia indica subsp. indica (strain ATCC 9039 / DSM 1715 / NCIMB 8712) TaxID=395963 RepID=B2IDJ6_BEII9|nr:glucan biosynthesis protein D [Beijerinckia indica]ACB95432.1 periplasmic glucan biosynthesis protein MdoG [Beijerinckia indica subsp. indica ATCC 9039]
MIERRDFLKFTLGGVAMGQLAPGLGRDGKNTSPFTLASSANAEEATTPAPKSPSSGFTLGEAKPFEPANVTEAARALARQAYKPLRQPLPDVFAALSHDQYGTIYAKPGTALWAGDNLGFAIEPLHRGFIFSDPMEINIVEHGAARRLVYDQAQFAFGKLAVPNAMGDIGFSGFRILVPQDAQNFGALATFQGASFFHAIARGQSEGVTARALSIKTADPRGEEFPAIRAIWIETPTLAENALTLHALIDSESVAGAYRFTLHPSEATIIDTECTLFARTNVDRFGLATMTGAHLLAPVDQRHMDDLRPQVSEVGGLAMLSGRGEWLWRPVANRETLQISVFTDEKPHGFGFLQRDRAFDAFQDDFQHWETRPSLWIEPIGEWAAGALQLIEIPSDAEINDNILAFWQPRQALAPGSETSFAYRQFWCWTPPVSPPLAITTASRQGHGSAARRRRFLVQFTGPGLADPQKIKDVKPNLTATPGTILDMRTFALPERQSYRIVFELDPGTETTSEMRLVLEVAGVPISETWLYRWTP